MDISANTIAALSALASAIAAIASMLQARKATKGVEATVLMGMTSLYGTEEMRRSISDLSKFRRAYLDEQRDISRIYTALQIANPEEAIALRQHSRRVSTYFCDCYRLYDLGLISRGTLITLVSHPGLNVFYEIAVPINHAKNSGHNSIGIAKKLRTIVPQHGKGVF